MLMVSQRKMVKSVAVSCMLLVCSVLGLTTASRLPRGGSGRGEGDSTVDESCDEGWLYTHRFCLMYTGMPEQEADEFCSREGALQARGICIKKPAMSESSLVKSLEDQLDDVGKVVSPSPSSSASSSSMSSDYVCPKGWTQFKDYCFIKPGAVPEICNLLGAQYIFNHCVTRLPHQLSTDFMSATKRLEGSDYDLHRDTRLCCCRGVGYCK